MIKAKELLEYSDNKLWMLLELGSIWKDITTAYSRGDQSVRHKMTLKLEDSDMYHVLEHLSSLGFKVGFESNSDKYLEIAWS